MKTFCVACARATLPAGRGSSFPGAISPLIFRRARSVQMAPCEVRCRRWAGAVPSDGGGCPSRGQDHRHRGQPRGHSMCPSFGISQRCHRLRMASHGGSCLALPRPSLGRFGKGAGLLLEISCLYPCSAITSSQNPHCGKAGMQDRISGTRMHRSPRSSSRKPLPRPEQKTMRGMRSVIAFLTCPLSSVRSSLHSAWNGTL